VKKDEDLEIIETKGKFVMPKWMDCTWRRLPCNQDDCPICGRIKRDRERHLAQGENPDSMEAALEDVSNNFKEALSMIKKDAERLGIDITNIENIPEPPQSHEFPLYNKIEKWRHSIYHMAEQAEDDLEAWPFLEAGEDLLWYANTILTKTYRQLCNRWHLEQGDEYGKEDYDYTKYVLSECLDILKTALEDLANTYQEEKGKFNLALIMLSGFEKEILKI
jgi:hypothetical protein